MVNKFEQPREDIQSKEEDKSQKVETDDKIEEVEKAREMAKEENSYAILSLNARKAGLDELADKYAEKGGEMAKQAGEEWVQKQEIIKEQVAYNVEQILAKQQELLAEEEKGVKVGQIDAIKLTDLDLVLKLEQVLGSAKEAYSTNLEGEEKELWIQKYETSLERVIMEKKTVSDSEGKFLSCRIEVLNKLHWQKELNEIRNMKNHRKRSIDEKKEEQI